MSLTLHLGASGSGKSHDLYKMITSRAAQDFDRNFLLIVPEQFTLQTQKDMISAAEGGGIMNIDVLSFPRLAHRVFEEAGFEPPVTLEDTGKTMIVKKVALDNADRLGIYAGKVHRQGFIQEMKSVIAEFYQYGIGDDELQTMYSLAEGRPQLENKLHDIEIIYRGFRDFISGKFIMNEELLEILTMKAADAKVLKDACVCFDGFTGFTVMQLRVIECLLKQGCEVHVTLTVDPDEAEQPPKKDNLFFLSQKTIFKLESLAQKMGCEVKREVIRCTTPYRFLKSPSLAALEADIFRRGNGTHDPDGIQLLSCENPLAEVHYLIGELIRLTAEEGYRYGETAVIVGDIGTYGKIIEREFSAAGIPFFLDSKKNIVGTAPVEMLKAVMEAADTDMSYESVFRFLKSGLTNIDTTTISHLENYCLARAIRGRSMWDKTWSGSYRTRYEVDVNSINRARKDVYALLGEAVQELKRKDATVRDRIGVLRGILESCNVRAKLEEKAEKGRTASEAAIRAEALEAGQLYGIIETVFERILLLLGDDVISLREFEEILNTGFAEAKLAMLPQGTDSVVIGDMERTRLNRVRALFLIGVNEGMLPAAAGNGGILSDSDRTVFEEHEIELSPTGRANAYLNEFYLYLNLTKPSEKLYLVSHRMTADKKPGRPSYICSKLRRMYSGLEIKYLYSQDEQMLPGSDKGVCSAAAAMRKYREKGLPEDNSGTVKSISDTVEEGEMTVLYSLLTRNPKLYSKLAEAAFFARLPESITSENARKLYGEVIVGSVTRLEKYASCAFAHFMNYGLRLEERPEYEIGSVEMGNIYHKAIECYCNLLKHDGIRWHDTTFENRRNYEANAVEEALREYEQLLGNSKRNEYIKTRLERILSRTIDVLDEQVKAGDFEPEFYEQSFRHTGEFMSIDGKIDRVDVCERDGHHYLRIIDYKSGTKSFDLTQLFYGLQIQLAVYMREGMKEIGAHYGDVGFTGMFYYNIDDPVVEAVTGDEAENAIRKALRLQGPSNEEGRMLGMHDRRLADDAGNLIPGYTSDVICAGVTRKGELSSGTEVFTDEQFKAIGDFTEQSIRENCSRILAGSVEVNPFEMDKRNGCTYCVYHGICGFERRLGDRFRKIPKNSEDELWQKLNGALNKVE